MSRAVLALIAVAASLPAGCLIAPVDLEGRPCAGESDCVDGWTCREGICVEGVAPDAGVADAGRVDAGADAGQDAGSLDAGPPMDAADPDVCGDDVDGDTEECDDGNTRNDDGCLTSCVAAECGDGYRELGQEDCDFASGEPGAAEGCDSSCNVVAGWLCAGLRSRCVEQVDGGPLVLEMPGGAPTLLQAIEAVSPDGYVFVSGGPYDEYLDMADLRATVIADGPVTLTSPGLWVVQISGTDATTSRFEGFEITNSNGGGVRTEDDASRLELVGNRIGPTAGYGVHLRRGTEFLVQGNFISDNEEGALRAERAGYLIQNNIVVNNGSPEPPNGDASEAGGLRLKETGVARFNTIVGNAAREGRAAGIECENAGVAVVGNYVVDNTLGAGLGQIAPECELTQTLLGEPRDTDAGPVDPVALGFRDDGSYRLTRASACVDYVTTADGGAALDFDVDGDERPAGVARDCGADELH
jgi:hypothetical protein